jgi:hypothetical protein
MTAFRCVVELMTRAPAVCTSSRERPHANTLQVRVMYTPLIGDEKRDIVEYTRSA